MTTDLETAAVVNRQALLRTQYSMGGRWTINLHGEQGLEALCPWETIGLPVPQLVKATSRAFQPLCTWLGAPKQSAASHLSLALPCLAFPPFLISNLTHPSVLPSLTPSIPPSFIHNLGTRPGCLVTL